jgi:hypothetical protein
MKTSDERVLLFQTTTKPKTKRKKKTEKEAIEAQILRRSQRKKKKFGPFLDLCVSSLRRGHANLLCIVPILSDVPKDELLCPTLYYKLIFNFVSKRCGTCLLPQLKGHSCALNWAGVRLNLGLARGCYRSYLSHFILHTYYVILTKHNNKSEGHFVFLFFVLTENTKACVNRS